VLNNNDGVAQIDKTLEHFEQLSEVVEV